MYSIHVMAHIVPSDTLPCPARKFTLTSFSFVGRHNTVSTNPNKLFSMHTHIKKGIYQGIK